MTEFISRNHGHSCYEIIIKTTSHEHFKATEEFARRLIDHAKPVTDNNGGGKWIPVSERLPDKQHDWVLAACKLVPEGFYGVPHIAELRNGKWWADGGDFPLIDIGVEVTHWMPLPEMPKGE